MGLLRKDRETGYMETLRQRFSTLAGFFWASWLTSIGSMLLVVSTILILIFLALHIYFAVFDRPVNPYFDLLGFMILPVFFVAGLALLLTGTVTRRRRARHAPPEEAPQPLAGAAMRRRATIFGTISLLGLIILGIFSYEGYHFTDSVHFCSDVCHAVMQPEATAYKRSPHANVTCVSCHIGPGASWFVRSKLSGVRQVFAVLGKTYSRPIPTPVEDLRPARETCEVCHWPAKFHGSRLVVKEHFGADQSNTPSYSALVLKVGGSPHPKGRATGIHWHVDPRNAVRYRYTDEKRLKIVEVVQNTPEGEVRYLLEAADSTDASGQWRTMDCIDCHNRPTHVFEMPETAVDELLSSGRISPDIPFIRDEAVRALRDLQPGHDTAVRVSAHLDSLYQADHPEALDQLRQVLGPVADDLAAILKRNIFPAMNVTWGAYTTHIGHMDAQGEMTEDGCFRCHDEQHVSAAGGTISQDCETCHALLAWDEKDISGLPDFVKDFLANP